ncbi:MULTISPECIES: hypothetical protein [Microbacterium]|uniref:hypothetical protein n=1 Tax=Microbacterium TaxID=33882 RepID=UPI0027D7AEC0|nr:MULTISPECIES: hypothetical protein [Microbacterium]
MDESLTVTEAKNVAQVMERELAAFVPQDLVAYTDQRSAGVLLRCSTQGTYQWTGSTTVRIVAGKRVDAAAMTSDIVAAYDGRGTLAASVERTSDGEPRAHIVGPAGAGYLVSEDPDRTGVRIASFSPCFHLPADMSPGDTY